MKNPMIKTLNCIGCNIKINRDKNASINIFRWEATDVLSTSKTS